MLQFLPMISTALAGMSALSAMGNTARGYQQTPAERAQLQSMANRERLLRALTNPDDVLLKNMAAQEATQLRGDTQTALADLLSADRRAQLLGRRSYFNPERRDESISQFLTKEAAPTMAKARSNALKRIMDAAGAYSTNASNYGGMLANQQAAQTMNRERAPVLLAAGARELGQGGSLSNIFQMLSGGGMKDIGSAMPWLGGAA